MLTWCVAVVGVALACIEAVGIEAAGAAVAHIVAVHIEAVGVVVASVVVVHVLTQCVEAPQLRHRVGGGAGRVGQGGVCNPGSRGSHSRGDWVGALSLLHPQ